MQIKEILIGYCVVEEYEIFYPHFALFPNYINFVLGYGTIRISWEKSKNECKMEEKKLFLLDAYALIFRAYYALIKSPRFTSGGFNTSAIFGFVNTLHEILKKENPTHIAVCFDPPGPTFRHEAYDKYKAEREETPEDIKLSVPVIKDIIRAFNIPIIEVPGYEADDVIASMAVRAEKAGFVTYMMTPDKDFGQLVTDKIKIYKPGYKGGEYEIRGVREVCERYNLHTPLQVIDLLALMGDKVDNIPGCPGVGEVTAEKLIAQFGSVENMLNHTDEIKGALRTKIENNAESIIFSKYLATIKTDVPVEFNEEKLLRKSPDNVALRSIFEKLEFRTFISRIIGDDKSDGQQNAVPVNNNIKKQPSLFDFDDNEHEIGATAEKEIIPMSSVKITIADTENAVSDAIAQLLKKDIIGMFTIYSGVEAVTSSIAGVALCDINGRGYYIPLSINQDVRLNLISPLLENKKILKVSCDLKFDMVLFRRHNIIISAPYTDVAIAHYLLQPEQSHSIEHLAEIYLHATLLGTDDIFDTKAKRHTLLPSATIERIAEYGCSRASASVQLNDILMRQIESENMLSLFNDIELPLVPVLADMEYTGVSIDTSVLDNYSKELTAQMMRMEQECYELAGEHFNTASPMQVGEILFEKLKIDSKAKRTRGGQYSTTEEVLNKLIDRHPLVAKILELRSVRKLLTTYVNSLPCLVNPITNRIHTTYNQTVTATGRLSSTNPNLQNIPIRNEEGREIRRAFIPSAGNLFFSADYSQIELRLAADISEDETLIEAFLSDQDIHRATAAKIYHVTPDKVTDEMRRHAKTANFGILYGISAFGLSQRLNIPRTEAKALIDGYMNAFPGIQKFIDKNIELARIQGYVTTRFGRRRQLPDINSRNAVVRSFSERNAVNAPIQGTAADIIKIAMIRIFNRFNVEGIKSKMTLQVHDELNFDVIPTELEKVTAIVVEEMSKAYICRVPLSVSYNSGKNWLEAH